MAPNFSQCAASFINNRTAIDLYGFHGPTRGVANDPSHQISYEGCLKLCGAGADYYNWDEISDTILTWVLPALGVILQAPFESNEFWGTMFSLARWIGSPMTSMAYSLWNIRILSRASMLVDLAIPATRPIPGDKSDFSSMRDSFYLLTVMNQFTVRPDRQLKREAEGLLRIALFSKELPLANDKRTIDELRQDTTRIIKELRRRGVVPTFISTLWFWFAMAVSIQAAFGVVGENATAHDLALGFLLSFIPVLIMFSAVDRDFGSAEEVCYNLNVLVNAVIVSLHDPVIRQKYINGFPYADARRMAEWVETISAQCHDGQLKDFFDEFAGQARMRYHSNASTDGVAHPIITDIEATYIAARGRGWLDDERDARYNLVLGRVDHGLVWFDWAELYDVAFAFTIVTGTIIGAFTLSYFTPTIGLACRSGGYLVFWIIAFSLLLLELFCFWLITPVKTLRRTNSLSSTRIARIDRIHLLGRNFALHFFKPFAKTVMFIETTWHRLHIHMLTRLGAHPTNLELIETKLLSARARRIEWGVSDWTHYYLFRPLEVANSIWLAYMVGGQTFGSFNTCACQSDLWASGGGYIDFSNFQAADGEWILTNWTASTIVSVFFMGMPMLWVVLEWCLSSHLVTSDYDKARSGLRLVR